MAREKPGYRATADRLAERFGRETITKAELAAVAGVSKRTIERSWQDCRVKGTTRYSITKIAERLAS